MAIETVYADGNPVSTGDCPNPANAHGAPDASWAGPTTTNSNWTHRWSIGNPVNPLTANTQTITVVARKNGTGGTDPTLTVNLYENGTLISQIAQATITSTTGQNVTGTFAGTAITNRNNVEIELVSAHGGGGPTGRYEAQVTSITWDADTAVVVPSYPASSSWGFTASATGSSTHTEPASQSWGFSTSSTGSSTHTEPASQSWGFSATATGGPDVSYDVTSSWGFTQSATGGPSLSQDATVSWGNDISSTETTIRLDDASLSFGFTQDATGEVGSSGVPPAVTDLAGVAGGSGEVILTWSEPV